MSNTQQAITELDIAACMSRLYFMKQFSKISQLMTYPEKKTTKKGTTVKVNQHLASLWSFYVDNKPTEHVSVKRKAFVMMTGINPFEKPFEKVVEWCEKRLVRYALVLSLLMTYDHEYSHLRDSEYLAKFYDHVTIYVVERERIISKINEYFYLSPLQGGYGNKDSYTRKSLSMFRRIYDLTDKFANLNDIETKAIEVYNTIRKSQYKKTGKVCFAKRMHAIVEYEKFTHSTLCAILYFFTKTVMSQCVIS